MLASPPVSLIASNFGSVHPGDDAVPKTRMIIASGASCGRLNITLSTVLIGSSVAGGTGGGAAGGAGGTGPVSAVVAGADCWAWFSFGLLLHETSSRATAAAARTPRHADFIGQFLRKEELFCLP